MLVCHVEYHTLYWNNLTLHVPFEVKGLGFLMIWNEKCRNCVHGLWVRSSTVCTHAHKFDHSFELHCQFTFPFASRKQDWKKHWYFLTLTRLHSTTVSEWNFVLDSALERAWKITWVELWECRKLSFVLFLFYSITSKISGGKKIWDTLQKQSAHKLNCSRLFYLVSMRAKTF